VDILDEELPISVIDPLCVGDKNMKYLRKGGRMYDGGEVLLFPSKDQRDWSKFRVEKPHKQFKHREEVLVVGSIKLRSNLVWCMDLYSHYGKVDKRHVTLCLRYLEDKNIIPYEGNEDKLGEPVNG